MESIRNEAKYEGRRLVTSSQVPANIHKEEFRDLKPTEFVMNTIVNGYSLPFKELPPECHVGNNKSVLNDWEPIRIYVASYGIPCLIYLDDLWISGRNKDQCVKNRNFVRKVLQKSGWDVSLSKAVEPAQRILFLGLEICSLSMKFYVPEKKLCRVEISINEFLRKKKCQLRELASLVGFLQSLKRALGSVVSLMLRASYNFMKLKLEVIDSLLQHLLCSFQGSSGRATVLEDNYQKTQRPSY